MKKAFLRLFIGLLLVGTLFAIESKGKNNNKSSETCDGIRCRYLIPIAGGGGGGRTGGENVMPCMSFVVNCASLYCAAHVNLPH